MRTKRKQYYWLAAALTMALAISAPAATIHVGSGGSATPPYDSWATATPDIAVGVAAAGSGDTVLVNDGDYPVASQLIIGDITLISVNGPDVTTLYPTAANQIMAVTHANALVSGLTLRDATDVQIYGVGMALELSAGTVIDCVVRDCPGWSSPQAAVVKISGGLMTDCVIADNQSRSHVTTVFGTGIVQDSLISNNTTYYDPAPLNVGQSAIVRRCKILDNTANQGGTYAYVVSIGGPWAGWTGGRLENCLVSGNTSVHGSAVGLAAGNSRMVNCTVAGNTSPLNGFGVAGGGTMVNSIVSGNSSGNYGGNAVNASYSCAPELSTGVQNNISADPLFADAGTGDYTLQALSPCIDAGTSVDAPADDIDGTPRPLDGNSLGGAQHDMGAYEAPEPPIPPLVVEFTATPLVGVEPLSVTFTATAGGLNPNIASYAWDFDNDGVVDSADGPVAVASLAAGRYTVKLTAVNTDSDSASYTRTDYITVYGSADDVYVSLTGGSDTFPYDTWAKATPSMDDGMSAVNRGGMTVHVNDGVYNITEPIVLDKAVTVQSVNGPNATTVRRSDGVETLMFVVSDPGALVTGLSIKNALVNIYAAGMAIELSAGTVDDCIVTECLGWTPSQAGIVKITGGLMTESVIADNESRSHVTTVFGTGILEDSIVSGNYVPYDPSPLLVGQNGIVRRCEIFDNRADQGWYPYVITMGGPWAGYSGGALENCLVRDNTSRHGSIIGIMAGDSRVVNCTVAGNTAPASGVYQAAGTMINTIVSGNSAAGQYSGSGAATYSCAPELTSGTGNITADPLFVNAAGDDYHLQPTSPAIDAGLSDPWGPGDVDLDGEARIQSAAVDMGAFEAPPVCDCPALTAEALAAVCAAAPPTSTSELAALIDAAIAAAFTAAGCPLDDPCADEIRAAYGL